MEYYDNNNNAVFFYPDINEKIIFWPIKVWKAIEMVKNKTKTTVVKSIRYPIK